MNENIVGIAAVLNKHGFADLHFVDDAHNPYLGATDPSEKRR